MVAVCGLWGSRSCVSRTGRSAATSCSPARRSKDTSFRGISSLCATDPAAPAQSTTCFCTCVDAIDWLDESLRYHVNLFPATLLDASVDRIAGVLPDDRARRACCIELSEQQIGGDGSHLLEPVRALKEAGFLIAVDDVGFGRSSLESLLLLEPDIVKIDRAFVHGIGTARDLGKRRALMRLLDVARVLGADVVAEGIETERDLAVLRGSAPPSVRDMRLAARPSSPKADLAGARSLAHLAVGGQALGSPRALVGQPPKAPVAGKSSPPQLAG